MQNQRDDVIDKKSVLEILQIIEDSKVQREYFFNQLSESSNAKYWLPILEGEGYFNFKNNPVPEKKSGAQNYTVNKWPALDLLKNIVGNFNDDQEIIDFASKIIDEIILKELDPSTRVDNYKTNSTLVAISFKIPESKFKGFYLDFFQYVINSGWNYSILHPEISKNYLPKLLSFSKTKNLEKFIDIITDYNHLENKYDDLKTKIDSYWFKEAIKKNSESISKKCGISVVNILLKKVTETYEISPIKYSTIVIPRIDQSPKNIYSDNFPKVIIYFLSKVIEFLPPEKAKNLITRFPSTSYDIIVRLKIYIFNIHYEVIKPKFWEWFDANDDLIPNKYELFQLFKNHCKKFSSNELDIIVDWIESKEVTSSEDLDEETKNKRLAYTKKEWLSSLLESGNKRIQERYNYYNKINDVEIDHPGEDFYSETYVGEVSPLTIEDLQEYSLEEIVEYAIGFEETGGWREPTKRGLIDTLRLYVAKEPKKFVSNIELIYGLDSDYLVAIFTGLRNAWNNSNHFSFHKLLHHLDENKTGNKYLGNNLLKSRIADLISEGTKKEKNSFKSYLVPKAESILITFLKNTDSDVQISENTFNIATAVLNSTLGSIYTSLIDVSLKWARNRRKENEKRWRQNIKKVFDERLSEEHKEIELYYSLGKYLSNLRYLDKKWFQENINKIFPKDNDMWEYSMAGFLFFSRSLDPELYNLLKSKSNYERAIKFDFKDSDLNRKVIQHICIAYLHDDEKLKDSGLIQLILTTKKTNDIEELVRFIASLKDHKNKYRKKVKSLWSFIYNFIENETEGLQLKSLKADLTTWLSYFDEIDSDIENWIINSTRFFNEHDNNTWRLVNNLSRLVESSPREVGKIYVSLLHDGNTPYYDKNEIQNIVQALFNVEEEKNAKRICNIYRQKGIEFLTKIYKRNKK